MGHGIGRGPSRSSEDLHLELEMIEEEFREARSVFEAAGGSIKNASRSTKLDVWERVNLDDVLEKKSSPESS